ncbi:extracellular solute-binding protein [Propylenella binzhouense]|uniref:Extracellular solute-binding protein n=1 Tax=Propylenella binzhouense TaxID=2555902 RepID=A0A964T131_9HYPH|nr:extracellular solute-binding protein [Propylenella binzhouense]MYZ46438.1 extracellular solute-binding protein [Propylenella binzhouense]
MSDLSNPTRRAVLKYGAASLAMMGAVAPRAAWADSQFTVGTLGGSWGDGIKKSFVPSLIQSGTLAAEPSYLDAPYPAMISRLLAQPDNPPFSTADFLDIEHYMAADAGVLQDLDLDIVTNYKDVFPTAHQPERNGLKHWASAMTVPFISITYNTKLASAPTSWDDLWAASLKGKIGVPDFGYYGLMWLHAINKHLGGDEDNIDPAVEAISDLFKKNGALLIKNQEQAIKAYSDETIVMMPYWNGRTFALQESGVPLAMAYVDASLQPHNGFIVPKGTGFAKEANHFVNATLDGELQLNMTRIFRYPPSNRTVKLPPEMEHYAVPESALEKVVKLDWGKIHASRSAALERWNREILG